MPASAKRQTVHFTIWVRPAVKQELQRIATAEGLSLSTTGAVAVQDWLARRSHIQHRGIFQPMIEHAIAKEVGRYSRRLSKLLLRSTFASERTHALMTNLIGRQQGINDQALEEILNGADDTARGNITRESPQLASMEQKIEQWLQQD